MMRGLAKKMGSGRGCQQTWSKAAYSGARRPVNPEHGPLKPADADHFFTDSGIGGRHRAESVRVK
jgi:hypothetical protein